MAGETTSSGATPDAPPGTTEEDPLELAVERRLTSDGRHGGGKGASFTILRVPACVREVNRTLYEPRLVSVGPYYRGRAELRAMERHKWRYLRHLLQRAAPVPLRAFVRAVRDVESRARACYSEADADAEDGFAEMLLLDGCFVLEFFFKWHRREPDALCDAGWALVLLHSDLLLVENQVPFFVLEALFDAFFRGGVPRNDLLALLLLHLKPNGALLPHQPPSPCKAPTCPIDHLLHLFHEAFVPRPQAPPAASSQASPPPPRVIPCVSALREAGVRFVRKPPSPRGMFDITFDGDKGVMEVPPVAIDQASLPLLVNLVAFEQSRGPRTGSSGAPLTSYAALMASLVRTGKDVEELQRRGIVDNMLSSDDDAAANFFQSLGACSTMNYDDHLFAPLFADVKRYHDMSWHRHRARFMRDYCSNPWSVIAVVLAVLAFFFSLFNQSVAVYNLAHPQPQ
ncbi:hypothetical protein GQ55_1G114300 [Panicum hallii var. hallii]|uniref:Uncharacterized protein n=1 Tax=Panicum hallii var. hallii TaxID=1504633 RepID=A0A2T7F4L6_9POAL|nr:hypothetical protein GQ55_1G114300 [Panicum hallii var. hallii]